MSPALAATPVETLRNPNYDRVELETQYEKGVKHLHEMGIRHVPRKYILPVSERPIPTVGKSCTMDNNLKLPIIDFAELQGLHRDQVILSLANALENYGFFQLVNHGIPDEVIRNMMNGSKRFFEQPLVEREKYMSSDIGNPVRYGTSFNQTRDGVLCWRDFLKLVCYPLEEVLPYWPASPADFRELAVRYAKETKNIFEKLCEAIFESLGLRSEEKTGGDGEMMEQLKKGSQLMVLNCFPPCPQPDLTLGMPPHSDFGFLTLVLQDGVEGLQIQHQRKWLTISPIPGSFVVNVGDHLEIFSNGRYKSVLHRVLVNPTKPRLSVASLHSVPYKVTVRPAEKLITDTNRRRYKDTDFAAFLNYLKSYDSIEKNFLESRKLKL